MGFVSKDDHSRFSARGATSYRWCVVVCAALNAAFDAAIYAAVSIDALLAYLVVAAARAHLQSR